MKKKILMVIGIVLVAALWVWAADPTWLGDQTKVTSMSETNYIQIMVQRAGTSGTGSNGLWRLISGPNFISSLGIRSTNWASLNASNGLVVGLTNLVVSATGNVGIGTNNPQNVLSVTRKTTNSGGVFINVVESGNNARLCLGVLKASDGTYSLPGMWFNQNTPSFVNYAMLADSAGVYFNAPAGDVFAFRTNNGTAMTIYTNGNVGIGVTEPTNRLSVLGNIKATGTNEAAYFKGDGSLLTNLPSGGGGGAYQTVSNITASGTFSVNPLPCTNTAGIHFNVTLDAQATFDAPTNTVDGQILRIRFIQGVSGGYTVSTNGTADAYWKFGTGITGLDIATNANAVSYISMCYYHALKEWHVIGNAPGY